MPIHPRLDWPKIIFTNSFSMSQVASSCLYCAAVCVCGNTFRGRAAAHNKLIVGKEDAHNELPIIRFWRRSAKLYIYLLYKKTKRPHLQIKSNSSSLLLRKRSLVEFGTMSDFLPDDQYELTNQDRGRKKIKQKSKNRRRKNRKKEKRMIKLN